MRKAREIAQKDNQNKLYNIQYLRAFASIVVLLFHVTNLIKQQLNYDFAFNIFSFGYMGVDLFFVLSGFIISYIHFADFGLKSRLKSFFLKRFTRIFPVYWIVFFPVVIGNLLIPSMGIGSESYTTEIINSMFLVPQDHHPILDVAWTLRHEMFFYIIFGLLFVFNSKKIILWLGIIIWFGMSTYSLFFKQDGSWLLFNFIFSPLNLEFIFGCLVAFLLSKFKFSLNFAKVIIFLGIGLFLLSFSNEYFGIYMMNRVIQWGIPSTLLILGLTIFDIKSSMRAIRILHYLGNASYSIYLTHVPCIYLYILVLNKLMLFDLLGNFLAVLICCILTLATGCIFYQIVERPVLKFVKKVFFNDQYRSLKPITHQVVKSNL